MAKKKEIKEASTEVEKVVVPAKPTDVELNDMKGAVKSVKETYHKCVEKGDKIIRGKIEFPIGVKTNRTMFFNEQGRMTEEHLIEQAGNKTISLFNDKGLNTEYTYFHPTGDLYFSGTLKYDDKGLQIESRSLDAEGKLMMRSETFYNDNGQQILGLQYGRDDRLSSKAILKYDDRGFQTEAIYENSEGGLISRSTYKHDDKGQCIELVMYKADGSLDRRHFFTPEYDSDGKYINPNQYHQDLKRKSLELEENAWERDAFGNWIEKWKYYKQKITNVWVREIVYYGEQPPFKEYLSIVENKEELLNKTEMDNTNETVPTVHSSIDETKLARWVAEGSPAPDQFSTFRYYVVTNNEAPSMTTYERDTFEVIALMKDLIENMGAKIIHSHYRKEIDTYEGSRIMRYTLGFPNKGYLLTASQIQEEDGRDYDVSNYIRSINEHEYETVYTSQLTLTHPSDGSGRRDEEFEQELESYMTMCTLERIPEKPKIYMIQFSQNFYLKSHAVEDNFEIKDLDLNYGHGFAKFHNELMGRFLNESKGLVLFHGEPGTGKTYYIRHLLRSMSNNNKIVIYMPPNMVDHLVEPGFMTFISTQVEHYSRQGRFVVLLIEDAEPLLAKRQEGIRIQGVTNLLNMTDGLLNDMLNLQIICTFNVDLKKLDSALLRPGRLIARKEFKALSELDANLLAQRLGIKHHFKKEATLGKIYSFGKNMNTLIHDVEAGRDASTIIDDL